LHHADAVAPAEHAQREAEGGGRFSLACAGVHDQEAFLDGLFGDLRVLRRLALRHLGAVAFAVFDDLGHACPFTISGSPATTRTTRSARAARRWLSRPCRSANRRASALSATMPDPTSLETSTVKPLRR